MSDEKKPPELKAGEDPLNSWNPGPPISPPNPKRKFPFAKARRWRNKNGDGLSHFKVLPWFQPIAEDSRLDFRGLIKDLLPELADDMLAEFNCYSGLVVHVGWQILNDAGVWFCVQHGIEDQFEDLGEWVDGEGPDAKIVMALTTESIEKEKQEKTSGTEGNVQGNDGQSGGE